MECENCCYYDFDHDLGHQRCFFADYNPDYEDNWLAVAPCDRDDD